MIMITIRKADLLVWVALVSYLFCINHTLKSTASARYLMYAMVLSAAFVVSQKGKRYESIGFLSRYTMLNFYCVIILIITVFVELFNNCLDPGSLIQPIFMISCVIIGYTIRSIERGAERCATYLLRLILVLLLFAGIIGIPEYFMQSNFFYPSYGNPWQTYRVSSIFHHPIIYATSMTVGFIFALYLVKNKLIKAMLLVVFGFGVFTSLSRSSWVAFAVSMLFLFFAYYRKKLTLRKLFYFILGIVLFIALLISPIGQSAVNILISRFAGSLSDVSGTQRLGSIAYIFNDLIVNFNPITMFFGHGEDAAGRLMLNTTIDIDNFSTTDNEYLLILYNYGVIALGAVVYFFFWLLKTAMVKYNNLTDLQKALFFSCIALFITCFFYEITETKVCAWLALVIIGMLLYEKKAMREVSVQNYD